MLDSIFMKRGKYIMAPESISTVKVKISLFQAVEAHRVARG
jgi:hypothetical protein